MIAVIAKNFQLILYAGVALALAYGGWVVKSKFARAAEADRLQSVNTILEKQAAWHQTLLKQAETDRIGIAKELAEARANASVAKETVKETVTKYVKDDRACDIPVEVLRALNVQMGHQP